jgi:ribosome biogenesis GTPase / thiamine phosphate phosphatase
MQGRIIKIISDNYYVEYNKIIYLFKCRGKFRQDNIHPLVGDIVEFDFNDKVIYNILPRKNELIRPPISNIDQALIVMSVKQPEFSSNLLDKMLTIIEYNSIKPIICLTKLDLLKNKLEKDKIKEYIKYYKKIGYIVLTNTNLFSLKRLFKNNITVFTGQSGVGKSTLLNKIDNNLNLETNIISKALGRGKHTTRHVQLLKLNKGLVADTPGFSAFDLVKMSNGDIRDNFIEFNKYRHKCQYQDCFHLNEENCEIKKLVSNNKIMLSRYENYKKFINTKG